MTKPEYEAHGFIPCTSSTCRDKEEHCHWSWCGAPRNHPSHTQAHQTKPEIQPHEFVKCLCSQPIFDCNLCGVGMCCKPESDPIHQPQRQREPCKHSRVNEGKLGDEGYVIECAECGEDLSPQKQEPEQKQVDPKWQAVYADKDSLIPFLKRQLIEELTQLKQELQQAQQRIESLEAFMVRTAKAVNCLPSFSDPLSGNEHIFRAIEQLEAKVPKWIVTSQLAPEEERWCWTAYNGYVQETPARITDENEWQWADNDADNSSLYEISHWMYAPLPEPPKDTEPSK